MGCASFLFPEMDTITPLVIVVGIMAFISAWIAGGRQFSYVGLQIIFSFYLVAFEGFSAPTELAPARDRLIGILVALIVMWFVLDQLWPVRTVTAMRRSLVSMLRNEADLFRAELSAPPHEELVRRADVLRDHIGKTMASIRTMDDAVEYEFGVDRPRHIEIAQRILRAALTSVALIWNELAVLHKEEDADFLTEPGLIELRQKLAQSMDSLIDSVVQQKPGSIGNLSLAVRDDILKHPRYGEYAKHTIERFGELRSILMGLQPEPKR
jgi:multidrug resistance protein MdtO